jgi:hypothetical protein
MRRVVALVEIDGEKREMTFLTNSLEWSPRNVADLYRCRWRIEVFFKQIKQTLQLADFLGHNANAVRWQVWTALLTHVLLRYLSYLSNWAHSFTRLFTVLRAALWGKYDLLNLLASYGTAGGSFRIPGQTGASLFSRFPIKLWDSTRTERGQHQSKKIKSRKSKSHFTPTAHETLENQRDGAKTFPLVRRV